MTILSYNWQCCLTTGSAVLPFMEMEGDSLGNHLWKRKGTVWATAYENARRLFEQPLTPIVSYSLHQQCLTDYGKSVLQVMATVSYRLYVVK